MTSCCTPIFFRDKHLWVRPALPAEGVDVLLGNGLANARVWADVQLQVDTVPV